MIKIGQAITSSVILILRITLACAWAASQLMTSTKNFPGQEKWVKAFTPDPSVGFAAGKFYVIMQQKTDFVSDGPWLDTVQARAGADIDGDGKVDQWTEWQSVKEEYSQKPGFARIVDVKEAQLNCEELPEALAFKFEVRTQSKHNELKGEAIQPHLDRVQVNFQ